jgi:hypothetical protein
MHGDRHERRQLKTLADLQGFLNGTVMMDFAVAGEERYGFIERTVKHFDYCRLKRSDKAIVLRFLERVSGYPPCRCCPTV